MANCDTPFIPLDAQPTTVPVIPLSFLQPPKPVEYVNVAVPKPTVLTTPTLLTLNTSLLLLDQVPPFGVPTKVKVLLLQKGHFFEGG